MFDPISKTRRDAIKRLARLLRLAVVLNHSRGAHPVPVPTLKAEQHLLTLTMPDGWLESHPLTAKDLQAESQYQKDADMLLTIA